MKKLATKLLPPIASDGIKSFYKFYKNNIRSRELSGWKKIMGGPASGSWIYVPPNGEMFEEMITGEYDSFFWDYLHNAKLENQTIVDIGGHIGYHTMCFSALCGKHGKTYVFEPNPHNLERMELIFKKNEAATKNIEIKRYALSNFMGTIKFNYSRDVENQTSSGGYIEGSHKPLNDEVYERANFTSSPVKVDTLDNFIEEKKIVNLGLLKIDVEGAEHKVLEGGAKAIETHKPLLLIEVHSVSAMLYVCKFLYSLDYNLSILDEESASVGRCFISATPNQLTKHDS